VAVHYITFSAPASILGATKDRNKIALRNAMKYISPKTKGYFGVQAGWVVLKPYDVADRLGLQTAGILGWQYRMCTVPCSLLEFQSAIRLTYLVKQDTAL
jgi:hypothetical protein